MLTTQTQLEHADFFNNQNGSIMDADMCRTSDLNADYASRDSEFAIKSKTETEIVHDARVTGITMPENEQQLVANGFLIVNSPTNVIAEPSHTVV